MSTGHRQNRGRRSSVSGNPFVRFARSVSDVIDGYQEARAEAKRRYPHIFR